MNIFVPKIKHLSLSVLLVFILFICASCSKTDKKNEASYYSVTDDLNATISLDSIPGKIISLAPNLTEMIYKLGVENKLIGNTLYCNYPPEARKVTKVGDMITLDFEKIISLKPDLILITVEGNQKNSYNKLKELGFKVFVSNPRDFNGIKKTMTDLGKIFKRTEKAGGVIKSWDSEYDSITALAKSYPHKKAMFLVALNPVMIAGKNTFINELITSAGLKNIAEDSPLNYPVFSREEILKRNPECIITTDVSKNISEVFLAGYPEWKGLKAFEQKCIIQGDPDLYLRPGPRFTAALKDLFSKLHPREH